ncbi:MAG: filamentous hemagglutinin [Hydrogenophilales bacterium 16-64-46]|nr:MAG: filamentous hemagglutinin [Hydrogenophilales bacterium 16-64-46]OZA38416.1 MAG: filamentous hemagglutinin [Hydrogenophilales bacterium 17-64-34]HQS99775.1 filamentous hemagglutinin family protein [Thiobacillus sp.]
MNRNRYRLVFNASSGMMTPVAETARRQGKSAAGGALALAGALLAGTAGAELPVASSGVGIPAFVTQGQAAYQVNGTQAVVNQVGKTSVLNWQSFNVSAGHDVQFRQVDSLATNNLVQGASFTSLNRIWDINPSVIAGSISQAAGQKANIILVNSNGIAFMGGSQVNLNSFTASTLDMDEQFLDTFLPLGETSPQFENALDGSAARGFIKVFEGAQITAGSQGRVMLFAPTVSNAGTITADDGQVILGAASKVYLRAGGSELNGLLIEVDSPAGLASFDTLNPDVADGQLDGETVSLADPAGDRLGHVSNLGEISTPRGNVTMVGYAVNQMGIARATTSVVANGSIYLMAKDTAADVATQTPGSTRAGRVTLGENSLTEILPETADTATTQDGSAGTDLERESYVLVLGQDVRLEGAGEDGLGGARIVAPSGVVDLIAVDNPKIDYLPGGASDIFSGTSLASGAARVHLGSGATIDVSGLENVEVAAGRSVIEIELRGDELKDSPVNQDGPLRGQKVYIDIDLALAQSDAGESTLVARDTLLNLKAQQQRTVAERSTAGGTVNVFSKGEAIVESGVTVDLSGGSLSHAAGNVKTTLLSSNGELVDLSLASAEVRYDGIATRYVIDYGRWNVQEVIDLGQSYRYEAGYQEGNNAGSLQTFGIGALYAQPTVVGTTVTGERQRELGLQPQGAHWIVGYDDTSSSDKNRVEAGGIVTENYKLDQAVELVAGGVALADGFGFGDALADELRDTLALDAGVIGEGRVAHLTVLSNQAVTVRDAIVAPQGGSVTLTGAGIEVAADITALAGDITLTARNTASQLPTALPAPTLEIADGVSLTTRAGWSNDLPALGARGTQAPLVDGGSIALVAQTVSDGPDSYLARGEVRLGDGVTLDADGGAWLKANGDLVGGDGGAITVSGYDVSGLDGVDFHAYGVDAGGALRLGSHRIAIGGAAAAEAGLLQLDSALFEAGGFASYRLDALEALTLAADATIAPVMQNRELQLASFTQASGDSLAALGTLGVRDDRVREAVDVSLSARQNTAESGTLTVASGASIMLDPGARLTLDAFEQVAIDGLLRANGGEIVVTSEREVAIGSEASLDVSGVALTYIDSQGLTQGEVLAGGLIDLAGQRVSAEAGSRLDVSGAAPVQLDVLNESGGLGRVVGSEAGTLRVYADASIRLDGDMAAAGGSDTLDGGSFEATLGRFVEPGPGQSLQPAVLRLAAEVAPGQDDGETRLDATRLEDAGFDRLILSSRDAIRLEDGLDLGAARALPLREVTLDAAAILSDGGDARVQADALIVGNLDPTRRAASSATTDSGTLALEARLLDLVGSFEFGGMAAIDLVGSEMVRFSGVTAGTTQPVAEVTAAADLSIHASVVAPATYTLARLVAPGHSVRFSRTSDAPVQPLSALGSLTVVAGDIVQDGNLWAPFGQLEFEATGSLVFAPGSLTSVAADANSLIPFGKTQNGRDWVVDLDPANVPAGQLVVDALPDKAIRVSAATVEMQDGARIDLSGGGDLQAYEFTVGPGGSRDILADANTYAILPGYSGGFAPADAQEDFDRASGEAVYLSGVPGLADGIYTLLPAHYALLPGAYAVQLDSGTGSVLPGQAYSRQDGVRIAAGYVTDTRTGAPVDAEWQGVVVMTHEQVRARSEFTLTRASDFFVDGSPLPVDAGLLSISTLGSGAGALALDALYDLAAGEGGRGAQVDISALNLVVGDAGTLPADPDAVLLDTADLNALGADSLLLGATRQTTDGVTTLEVGSTSLTLANDAASALVAGEVMLAASDTLTLAADSTIVAEGGGPTAATYETAGNGAFVRAASHTAHFARTGSPDRSSGTLVGAADSVITAAASIILDATADNLYAGDARFAQDGAAVPGQLAVGATRISFGEVPTGVEGLRFDQAALDALDLANLSLVSYSTLDFYGEVTLGALDAAGQPVLQSLTLQGAGLAGIDNTGSTATIRAQSLSLVNPDSAAVFVPGAATGDGSLQLTADVLTLGAGDKRIEGFGSVAIVANEIIGESTGTLDVASALAIDAARIGGSSAAEQTLRVDGALAVNRHDADRELAAVDTLGAAWTMQADRIDFDGAVELPSGRFTLEASAGDVHLGESADIDVAGREVMFFDLAEPGWGGEAVLASQGGDVIVADGARVDVSAAAGGDAGSLTVRAADGSFVAGVDTLTGTAAADADGARGDGARIDLDLGTLVDFSALNEVLNSGGFDGARTLRVRSGDVSVAATDRVAAQSIALAVDAGSLSVAGELDASGERGGRILLYADGDVNLLSGARLAARASGTGETGGEIVIGTLAGNLDLAAGSQLDTTGGEGGELGSVHLRAPRLTGTDVAVTALASDIAGAGAVSLEAVQTYTGIATLNATGSSSGSTLSLETIAADSTTFATNAAAIETRLGMSGNPDFHLLAGVEVRADGDLTLAQDWNLKDLRAGGEAGVLTLRANGDLLLNASLSDGFSHATTCTTGACPTGSTTGTPATLLSDTSWAYRLVSGADSSAADPLATVAQDGADVVLAAGKLVRTGTGDIEIASGDDILLADANAAIYSAGSLADPLTGFTAPSTTLRASYSDDGGDVRLMAQDDIIGKPSEQLFTDWLYRQGAINTTGLYAQQTSWWVRFDQFRQGVGALGGGSVDIVAGGDIQDLSANVPTQARLTGTSPDAATLVLSGGDSMALRAGGDILGGSYYIGQGELEIRAGGQITAGETAINFDAAPLAMILALGEADVSLRAGGDIEIASIVDPHLIPQSAGNLIQPPLIPLPANRRATLFSAYGESAGVTARSLTGDVDYGIGSGLDSVAFPTLLGGNLNGAQIGLADAFLPPSLKLIAFLGDVSVGGPNSGNLTLSPSPLGTLDLLAGGSVELDSHLTLSDMDPEFVTDPLRPAGSLTTTLSSLLIPALLVDPFITTSNAHAATPVHADDRTPVRVYAREGDVVGVNLPGQGKVLNVAKPVDVRAGNDIVNFSVIAQHNDATDVSRFEAGRDLVFDSTSDRRDRSLIRIGGPGRIEVVAGRTIDLGTSGGIQSRGNIDNPNLPSGGADIHLAAGVGEAGLDYAAALARLYEALLASPDDADLLWQARWLAGDDTLESGAALAAVSAVLQLDAEDQRAAARNWLFAALRETGRQANQADSGYGGDFARGYAALEWLFPGIGEQDEAGTFTQYAGDINLFASRVKTEDGGDIEFFVPGGDLIVGLPNTPAALVDVGNEVLGMVVAAEGSIRGMARDDMLVNQSRILTVGGGDVLLWSSEGDIDAGKGKKTASAVPPPIVRVDAQGNITLEQQGAVTGSGIGALFVAGGTAGDVDLIAPKGTVNAGDAGIRAGNLNIAAQVVLGADNITVSGTSTGTPVADTSAVTAASSGASNAGGDVSATTAALAQNLAEAARTAEELKKAFRPTFISAEVVGHGE